LPGGVTAWPLQLAAATAGTGSNTGVGLISIVWHSRTNQQWSSYAPWCAWHWALSTRLSVSIRHPMVCRHHRPNQPCGMQACSARAAALPDTCCQPQLQRTWPAVRSMLGFTSSTPNPSSCAAAYTRAVLPHPTGPSSAMTLHLQHGRKRQHDLVIKRAAQAKEGAGDTTPYTTFCSYTVVRAPTPH
jgi:hypothetical protein